ncbi:multidrug resistance protein mrp-7-like [Amblyomma americanum]
MVCFQPERCRALDGCSPFSRVLLTVLLRFLKNTIIRSEVVVRDIPRLTHRLRCNLNIEDKSQDLLRKAQRRWSPYRVLWLVIRHCWKEHLWGDAVTLLYYLSMMLRIPLFHGLLGDDKGLSFNESVLLLLTSCAAQCLLSSAYAYNMLWAQLRAQLLLQTAVFKKATRLSAASVASNTAGHVCSLLVSDAWVIPVASCYVSSAAVGFVCAVIAVVALGSEIGYAPAGACLLWLLVAVIASFSVEPLVDKCNKVLYKCRDERLRKFTDFLSSIRTIKMAALEGVFKRALLQLRIKEINQAYQVNNLDVIVETILSASSSVMMILAFGVASFTSPEVSFSPAILFSSVYTLSLMEALTNTMPYVIKFKSPAIRSSKRLISFFNDEEYCTGGNERHGSSSVNAGGFALEDCSFAWAKRDSQTAVPVLTDVNLRIERGTLVGIVGGVGSGKSSLLSSIAGDTRRLSGSLEISGSIAVVPQVPRVLNMSIRDNIIFGRKFDQAFYNKVLKGCQLAEDISRLPSGDLKEAGDKGEMLSGGQKQRVALARAVYTRSDIYLLDDPTSSQDPRVAGNIMQEVIGETGLLSGKTRVLVTNSTRLPLSVDQWVLMDKNTAMCFRRLKQLRSHSGSPTELFEKHKFQLIFRISGGVLLARATRHRSLALHAVMLERLAASPLSFFDSSPRGRIFNRFSVDLEVNDSRVFLPYKLLFQNVFYVLGRLAVIGVQAPIVFGLTCGAEAVLVFIMRHVLRANIMGRQFESTRASLLLQHLTETLECVGLMRCYNVTQRFCARFRRHMTSYLEAYNVLALFIGLSSLLITFCGQLIIVLTTAIAIIPAHGDPTSTADIGLSLVSSITVSFAMQAVFEAVFWTVQGDVAFKRALEYTDIPAEEEREATSSRKAVMQPSIFGSPGTLSRSCENNWPSRGEVIFDHYCASYRPGITDDTLKDISFVARPGEKVAIVGRTGAGKSSLVLALLRMIQRTSGTITIDDTDISTVPLKRLRAAVSVIPQDSCLFRGTLRDNLDPEGSHTEMDLKRVIGSVHMSDFVDGCSEGMFFAVSEKGGNLSAGQRQLVALARALLRQTRVLVLDEATSQMDPDTERRVQVTLRQSFAHCTLITIAHRIETIMDYDRVVIMGEGRVLESGRPIDLLANERSTFRSMALSAGIDPDLKGPNTSSQL